MKLIKLIFLFGFIILISLFLKYSLSNDNFKLIAKDLLSEADIKINGNRPWDIKVNDEKLYDCVLQNGSLGLGESYVEGCWDVQDLDQFFFKLLNSKLDKKVKSSWPLMFDLLKAKIFNLQSTSRAFDVGKQHYDLGNDLFQNMLDKNMIYSCGYWRDAKNLDEAQEKKLELICKKLNLQPGMSVLEIGCGWGGLAFYAAKNYGVNVVGLTVSKQQANFAQDCCKGLPVKILLIDYRDLNKAAKFDRIVSVGMFEHVGYKNYKTFMDIAHSLLKDDGLFLLHTIGSNTSNSSGDPWINKYIFPNGMLPSVKQIAEAAEGLFVLEDWHNFGTDYDKTLMAWFENFNNNWDKLKSKYDEKFYRMWKYYLLSCAGLFRARAAQLWQIIFSKGNINGYESVR